MNYDIIGDIHGHAEKLTALLAKLGYREQGGAWRQPEKTAIFVGDFVDRGRGQLATIDIVRRMVDCGSAQAVLGNHEFNAIAWYMPDPAKEGAHLRAHNPKNRHQHAAFLAEVEHDKARHREVIDWFMTLPLWLETDGFRVIHACWHPGHMKALEPYLYQGRRLNPAVVEAASRLDSMLFQSIEALIKGPQIRLPEGVFYFDEDGHKRRKVRTRWWDPDATTYRTAALLSRAERERLPNDEIPASSQILYANDKPLFIGHYWNSGAPAPLTPHIACVDYSVGNGGALVAYRWEGEPELKAEQFVAV